MFTTSSPLALLRGAVVGALLIFTAPPLSPQSMLGDNLPAIPANSNRTPGGKQEQGVLTLNLELRQAEWYPEAETGPCVKVYAFGEEGKAPQVPGPLIRVPQGAEIHVTLRNLLPTVAVVHGMHQRPGEPNDVVKISPGEVRELRFSAGTPGTYQYWASAGEKTVNWRVLSLWTRRGPWSRIALL